jgi:hypothetical protein
MIKVFGQLCYSPHPPDRYTYRGLYGLGVTGNSDIQLWNMMYLSANLEDHLDPPSLEAVDGLIKRDFNVLYTSLASLKGPNCVGLFPRLRDSLMKPPSEFLKELWTMPWRDLPQMRRVPNWDEIIIERAIKIDMEANNLAIMKPQFWQLMRQS